MSFLEKNIPDEVLSRILGAAASSAWLGKWKLLAITHHENRVRVVSVWQEALRRINVNKDAEFIERWKSAPLFIVFCQPKQLAKFHFVPPEHVRIFSIQEIGGAVRSLELSALTHGIGLHGIMGILVPEIGHPIKQVLQIPSDHEIVYFGIMGYPREEVEQKFPKLETFTYSEQWGKTIQNPF
jgi:Nitroreductase family